MFNVLQKSVKTELYAVIRLLPTAIFFLVIVVTTSRGSSSLRTITFAWLLSIFIIFLFYSWVSSHYRNKTSLDEYSAREIKKFARNGFIAHVNFQDLFKVDYIIIPAIKSVMYSATYFSFIGLSQWPKVLIDGLCTGLMPRYQIDNLEFNLRRTRRISLILVAMISFFLALLYYPLSIIVAKIVGPNYLQNVRLFFIWSICACLIYSRRICLDPLRASNAECGSKASEIEVKAGLLGSIYIPVLFISSDLTILASTQLLCALGSFAYVQSMSRRIKVHEQ